jgi:hypothetical protein
VLPVEAAGAGWSVGERGLGPTLRELWTVERERLPARRAAALELAGRYGWDSVAERYERTYERIAAG